MPFRWWPSLTVMIHQQRIVWICAISSSCTEYVIISKHLWIVIAPWLRLSLSIKSSFITLICRTTIFHSDCLAWIFISVLFFPPPTHHCSLFISLKKKGKKRKKQSSCDPHGWDNLSDRYLHFCLCRAFLCQQCPLVGFYKSSIKSTWLFILFQIPVL